MEQRPPPKGFAIAFLLAQIGAFATKQFAERLSTVQLTPPHAGILRILSSTSEISQQELARQLGTHASRMVAIVDEMESLGLVARGVNSGDRRSYSLQITPKGKETFQKIVAVSRQHNESMCEGLSETERETLANLLQRVADHHGLKRGVHPGYGSLGIPSRSGKAPSVPEEEQKR